MKKIFTIFCFFISVTSFAQNPIPNPGFEDWNGNDPLFWMSTNNNPFFAVTPSTLSHSGDSAARGEVIPVGPSAQLAPLLISSSGGQGFPVTQWYTSMTFWYTSNMQPDDELEADVLFFDSTAAIIGAGSMQFLGSSPNYVSATVPIVAGPGTPSTCIVTFSILNSLGGTPGVGSYFIVDDVDLVAGPSGIDNPDQIQQLSVFPNPAYDNLYVNCSPDMKAGKHAALKLYDLTGRLVLHQTMNNSGTWKLDVSSIVPGTYVLEAVSDALSERCKVQIN